MEFISVLIIALALSMDSFAVSVSNGISIKDLNFKKALVSAFFLAIFQAGMPLLGWLVGVGIGEYLKHLDHWIAFGLLSAIGIKMIREALSHQDKEEQTEFCLYRLIGQSVATSIDAAAVGITFGILKYSMASAVLIIGAVTFIAAFIGMELGKYIGKKISGKAEIIGGIVLIGIGNKILVEHLIMHYG